MNRTHSSRLAASALILALASALTHSQSLELKAGYITGTVSLGGIPLTQLYVNASSGSNSSNFSGSSTSYNLTVNVPANTNPVYTVRAQAYSDDWVDYLDLPPQTTSVSEGQTSLLDFAVTPAHIAGTVTVNGGTLDYAYIYADNGTQTTSRTWYAQSSTTLSRGSQFRFPVMPGAVRVWGRVHFANGGYVDIPQQSLGTAVAGVDTPFTVTVTAPAVDGAIQGTLSVIGPRLPNVRYVVASGPLSRSVAPSPSGAFLVNGLSAGTYNTFAEFYFNQSTTYFRLPYAHAATGYPPVAVNGTTMLRDITHKQALIQGTFALTGTRTMAQASFGRVYLNGVGSTQTNGGHARDEIARPSGDFEFVVSAGSWLMNSSNQVSFFVNTPGQYLDGQLNIYDYLNAASPIVVGEGDIATRNLTYETGTVTVILRSPGVTFSSPRVSLSCSEVVNNQQRTFASGNFYGNQQNVNVAPVTFVGIRGQCTVTTFGRVAGSSGETAFGQVSVGVVPGSDLTVDVGGPTLNVLSPAANSAFNTGPITVSGTATDDQQVVSVTVNGTAATLSSSGSPNDPREVSFSASLPLANGANPIAVIATDNSGKAAASSRTVYLDSDDPTVTWTPADGTTYPTPRSITISGTAADNLGISSITVNGAIAYTNSGSPQTSANFSRNDFYPGGTHTLTVVVKDLGNRTITQTRTIVVDAPVSSTAVTTSPNPSVSGQNVTVTATVSGTSVGTPTGLVDFRLDGNTFASAIGLNNGVASVTLPGSAVGAHSVTASYHGSSIYLPSSGNSTHTVDKIATTTSLTSTKNPSTYGEVVTFSSTVASVAPGAGTPTGSLQFRLNGLDYGLPVNLVNGTGSFNMQMNAGSATAEVRYLGSTTHAVSSATASQTVNPGLAPLSWSNPAPIVYGTALGATQLNASSSIAGSFVYTPAVGTILTAGSHTLGVTFTPTSANYAPRTLTVPLTVNRITPTVSTSGGSFSYNGSPRPSTGTANIPGTFTYAYSPGGNSPPVNASATPYSVSATFTPEDTVNYAVATATSTITITKATPVVTWANPAAITYGTSLGAGQLNAASSVAGSFVYTPAAGALLDAGSSQPLNAIFTPDDAVNYAPANTTARIDVGRAVATLTLSALAHTYDGSAKTAVVTTSPAGLTPVRMTYNGSLAGPVNAGTYAVSATLNHPNYEGEITGSLVIGRARPVLTWSDPADIVYGAPLGVLQLNASSNVPGTISYTPTAGAVLGAGAGQTLSVSFAPADTVNYHPATGSVLLNVLKATPTVTWSTPADLTYGTALSPTQLNATASTVGTFVYSPAAGAKLNAGNGQTLSVAFTPADTINYNGVETTTVKINVLKATPTVTWSTPGDITYGTPLSAARLNATADVAGAFAYTPGLGTILTPGSHTLQVVFTPTDTTNHSGSSKAVPITVNEPPVISSLTGPSAPIALGLTATISVDFSDPATADAHWCDFRWDDGTAPETKQVLGTGSGTCAATRQFTATGVYAVGVTVRDDDALSASTTFQYVVVYDPNAGFVTGGGWVESQAGSYTANPALSGRANFGFVSKYKKGMTVPTGDTEFHFNVAGFRFVSSAYEWLVVSGAKAQYKGIGTVNGAGDFGFILTATDGQISGGGGVDRFRIKIWDRQTGAVIYDNVLGASDDLDSSSPQALGAGSIVIHVIR